MVAAVALDERGQDERRSPLLPPEVLVDLNRREPCLLVPDADAPGLARMLDLALRHWDAAVGPTVPLANAAKSLEWGTGHARARAARRHHLPEPRHPMEVALRAREALAAGGTGQPSPRPTHANGKLERFMKT